MNFEIIIKNGTIIDGTGNDRYHTDIGINNGKIDVLANLSNSTSKTNIDATGLVITPGFIDMHTHSDVSLLDNPEGESKIFQGITTEVIGNCSYSPFPVGKSGPFTYSPYVIAPPNGSNDNNDHKQWNDLNGWANFHEARGIGLNLIPQVGQSALQYAVGATEKRSVYKEEMKQMQTLLIESIEQGAFSITTGLSLSPSGYMSTDELITLCRVLKKYTNVFYATHAREINDNGIQEAIKIGLDAEIPVQYSHIALIDPDQFGKAAQILEMFENATAKGLDITYDVYPYTAAQGGLNQSIPGWAQSGTLNDYMTRLRNTKIRKKIRQEVEKGVLGTPSWNSWIIANWPHQNADQIIGKSVHEIAIDRGIDPAETVLQLEEESYGTVSAIIHNRTEEDLQYFLTHPLGMYGSDGVAISPIGKYSNEKHHPRFYGTYPRILGHYVREKSIITLEQAVHKMTGKPAKRLNLKNRGVIKERAIADITIFNSETISDKATFKNPHILSKGVMHVLVNGIPVISDEKHTKSLPGKILRRNSE